MIPCSIRHETLANRSLPIFGTGPSLLHPVIRFTLPAALITVCGHLCEAAPITGLFPTGSNGAGGTLGDGMADLHYELLNSDNPFSSGDPYGTTVNQASIPRTWVPNLTTSRWISDHAIATTTRGAERTFRITFDLHGFDPRTASIVGSAAADDTAKVLLNGSQIGTLSGFTDWSAFSASSGFLPGLNTLDFVVIDTAGVVAGLHVRQLSGTVNVPSPASTTLLTFGGMLVSRRRR